MQVLSYFFSILSMCFYSVIYFPQLKLIHKTKSSQNISIWMVILWSQGDTLSLISTSLMKLDLPFIILSWYYLITGFIMISFVIYYSDIQRKTIISIYSVLILDIIASIMITIYSNTNQNWVLDSNSLLNNQQIGTMLGWFTIIFYLVGRLIQIISLYKNKNSEGVSKMMYIFTIAGNISYLSSILTYSLEPEYIQIIVPWIVLVCVTVTMDIIILIQCKCYSKTDEHINKHTFESV